MSDFRVAVTGVGFACPAGTGSEDVFDRLVAGVDAVAHEFEGFPVGRADVDVAAVMGGAKAARRTDRVTHLGVAAAQAAVAHAGLDPEATAPNRVGVVMGTGIGGISTLLEQDALRRDRGPERVSPFFVPMFMPNATAAQISLRYGFGGPNTTVTTACAAGAHAIGDAALAIRCGHADVMLAGGAEACILPVTVAGFSNIRALSRRGSRPFDARRDGFVLAEGAAVVVLEESQHARARGARVLCELAGYGRSSDAHHVTAPRPDGAGAVRAMEMALSDARLTAADVGYVNAHGTSTPLNDAAEAAAIQLVFGQDTPPVSSTKSMVGHLIGAAGALEAAVTAMALAREVLPPTINHVEADPAKGLDVVPNEAREAKGLEAALSNSFGFGGHNAVLAFRRS